MAGGEETNQRRLDANEFGRRTDYHSDQVKHQRMTQDVWNNLFKEAESLTQPDLTNWLLSEHSPFVGQENFAGWMQRYKENPDEGRRFLDALGGWQQALTVLADDKNYAEGMELRNQAYAQNFQHVLDPLMIERMRMDNDYDAMIAGGGPFPTIASERMMPRVHPDDIRNKSADSPLYETPVIGAIHRTTEGTGRVVMPVGILVIENLLRINHGIAGVAHQLARESSAHRFDDPRRIGRDTDDPEAPFFAGAGRVLGAGLRGFALWDRYTFEDVLAEVGVEDAALRSIAGFVGDVLLDPLTYVTMGAGAGIKLGLQPGYKVLKGARLATTGRTGVVKGASLGKQGYDAGKHSWVQLRRKGERHRMGFRDDLV